MNKGLMLFLLAGALVAGIAVFVHNTEQSPHAQPLPQKEKPSEPQEKKDPVPTLEKPQPSVPEQKRIEDRWVSVSDLEINRCDHSQKGFFNLSHSKIKLEWMNRLSAIGVLFCFTEHDDRLYRLIGSEISKIKHSEISPPYYLYSEYEIPREPIKATDYFAVLYPKKLFDFVLEQARFAIIDAGLNPMAVVRYEGRYRIVSGQLGIDIETVSLRNGETVSLHKFVGLE